MTWGACLTIASIDEGRHSLAGAFLLGLASLTRPEGVLIAPLLMILSLAAGQRSRKTVSGTALWIGVFLVVWAPYFLWRWQYYGYLLPNTFYAKVDIGGSQIMRGLGYLHAFWKSTGYWLLLPITGIAFLTKRRSSLITAALVAAYILYIVYVGGDGLPMYRFLAPILGLLFLLVAQGAEGWLTRFGHRRTAGSMVALAVVLAAAYAARPHFKGPEYAYVQQDIREVSAWKEIGLWFREHSNRGDMIAVVPAGAIPYFSGLAALDMLGLNDVTIAHTEVSMGEIQAGHEKYNIDYMLQRAPTYFIVGIYGLSEAQGDPLRKIQPYYPVELHLMSSPEFQRRYRPKLAKSFSGYFTYFEKREPPDGRP
ncbi:hypothetical protein N9903_00910 [bacterium]|nr:hypothetical protein [bacterium]